MAGITPTGSQSLTVSTASVGLTIPNSAGLAKSMAAYLTVEGGPIRFWVDGTAPTNATGHLLNDGDQLELTDRDELSKFRAIRDASAGANATVRATFFVRYQP